MTLEERIQDWLRNAKPHESNSDAAWLLREALSVLRSEAPFHPGVDPATRAIMQGFNRQR